MAPDALTQVLRQLPPMEDENLLVGFDTADDGSAYRIEKDLLAIQTVDLFPPMVDNPYEFGKIAAANALSDIYAMGGDPKLVMNIFCYPETLSQEIAGEILRGGYEKVKEAGALVTGGHTIRDHEPKYGLAVTGFIKEKELWTNSGAQPGDDLILSKALGSGILNTAVRCNSLNSNQLEKLIATMERLNKYAYEVGKKYTVHSCTDITGFGLLGHGYEMAQASQVTLEIYGEKVPLLSGTEDQAEKEMIPGGAYTNKNHLKGQVEWEKEISSLMELIFFDPQTSGGLLFSVSPGESGEMLQALQEVEPEAAIIGKVLSREEHPIKITGNK